MKYIDEHLPIRILYALLFGAIFAWIGVAAPDFYYRYLDRTVYYTVSQPIPVNQKWYKPCQNTILTATRTSLVDTQASFFVDLVLTRSDGREILKVPDGHLDKRASVKAGERLTVSVVYPLPCTLPDGLYFWQATMRYNVRGIEKQYTYVSDTFNVNQFGLDPDLVKIATESAKVTSTPIYQYYTLPRTTATPAPQPTGAPASPQVTVNVQNAGQSAKMEPTPQPTPQQPSQAPTPTQPQGPLRNLLDNIGDLL